MDSVIQRKQIRDGFAPSRNVLRQIAATRKSPKPHKLGYINYYGWYDTDKITDDRNWFIIALAIESLILILQTYLAIKNGYISSREWLVLGFTASFVIFDIISLRIIPNFFYTLNYNKQTIEILPSTDITHRNALNSETDKYLNKIRKAAIPLVISCILKIVGIHETNLGLPIQIILMAFSLGVLLIHYNFSPYFIAYNKARKGINAEYNKWYNQKGAPVPEPDNQAGEINGTKYIDKEVKGINSTIFSLQFKEITNQQPSTKSSYDLKIHNNCLILDEEVSTTSEAQRDPNNQSAIAELLIARQINI